MTTKWKRINVLTVVLMGFLLSQTTGAQNVLMTGWGTASTQSSLDQMDEHITGLGYTVTQSNIFPGSLESYDILILMGGNNVDIPEAVVDNFVNAGGGLIIFEGIVQSGSFDITANSNPVSDFTGWDERTGAAVIDPGHDVCTGLSETCSFVGYSTNPVMKNDAHIVIVWDDQVVFAATYSYGSGLVVYINDLKAWYYGYWRSDNINGKKLMENALAWVGPATDVDGNPGRSSARGFTLCQNFPNPFNASTRISYFLPNDAVVTLQILDIQGRTLRVLENSSFMRAGNHTVSWDGRDGRELSVSSGVYIYQLQADDLIQQGKMIISK
jgi:hypothetical protein